MPYQQTIETYGPDGVTVETITVETTVEQDNEQAIRTQARAALGNNRDFLAIASPSNAQNAAQIKALTRQVNGLIRLAIGALDATS